MQSRGEEGYRDHRNETKIAELFMALKRERERRDLEGEVGILIFDIN